MGPRTGLDGCEKSRPIGIRSPDRPARSKSLPAIGNRGVPRNEKFCALLLYSLAFNISRDFLLVQAGEKKWHILCYEARLVQFKQRTVCEASRMLLPEQHTLFGFNTKQHSINGMTRELKPCSRTAEDNKRGTQ